MAYARSISSIPPQADVDCDVENRAPPSPSATGHAINVAEDIAIGAYTRDHHNLDGDIRAIDDEEVDQLAGDDEEVDQPADDGSPFDDKDPTYEYVSVLDSDSEVSDVEVSGVEVEDLGMEDGEAENSEGEGSEEEMEDSEVEVSDPDADAPVVKTVKMVCGNHTVAIGYTASGRIKRPTSITKFRSWGSIPDFPADQVDDINVSVS